MRATLLLLRLSGTVALVSVLAACPPGAREAADISPQQDELPLTGLQLVRCPLPGTLTSALQPEQPALLQRVALQVPPDRPAPATPRAAQTQEQEIGPAGGVLRLAAGHALGVPFRSLARTHRFQMHDFAEDDLVGVQATTDAPRFNRGALLTISYARCPPEVGEQTLVVVRLREGTFDIEENLGGVHDRDARTVTAIIDRLSGFAVATN